jgi:hypothetical protein
MPPNKPIFQESYSPLNSRLPQSKAKENSDISALLSSNNNNKYVNSNLNQKSDNPKKVGRPPINRNDDANVFDRNKPAKTFSSVKENKQNNNQIFDESNLKFNSQKEME